MQIMFDVLGVPGPQGSKSFKGLVTSKKTGKQVPRLVESSLKVKPWRTAVRLAAIQAMKDDSTWERDFDGPVAIEIVFYLPRPASAPKRSRIRAKRVPDVSKLLRATEDAITDSGLWHDDARVVIAKVEKTYAVGPHLPAIYQDGDHEAPGATIYIEALSEEEDE